MENIIKGTEVSFSWLGVQIVDFLITGGVRDGTIPREVLLRAVREEITKAGNEKKKEGKTTKSFTVNFFVWCVKIAKPFFRLERYQLSQDHTLITDRSPLSLLKRFLKFPLLKQTYHLPPWLSPSLSLSPFLLVPSLCPFSLDLVSLNQELE